MTRRRALIFCPLLLIPIAIAAFGSGQAQAPDNENGFGVSETLFSTLVAINAAGYDAGIDSPLNQRFRVRTQIREILAKRNIPCLAELRAFYQAHKKPTDTGELSQYVSFALIAGGPPSFELPNDVPPDVEPLRDFSPLLARFYKEANLEDLWRRSQAAYAEATSEYQSSVIDTLFEANGYVRNPSGPNGRRFQIFIDLFGAPDQVQVRSYLSEFFVVITPSSRPLTGEIRDAYLAYLLDPLTFRYRSNIEQKKALEKYAERAPALDIQYKDNFSLLVTKCLVKAIDSRLMHEGPEKREQFVNEAVRDGYVLTAAFADLLPAYEQQQESLREYYPDLINAIDVRKEEKRLRNVEFAQSVAPRVIAPPAPMQIDPAEQTLEAAEGLYEQRDFEGARKAFRKVFEQTADKSMHGKAYYGLARVAVQENRKDEALELFQRAADANPDPAITAWSHVYLGRLQLAAGDAEKAQAQFKLALAINGASPRAHEAAQKGLQSLQSTSGEQPQ